MTDAAGRIAAQRLADLVPCSLEHVSRLAEPGILHADERDGLFPSSPRSRSST